MLAADRATLREAIEELSASRLQVGGGGGSAAKAYCMHACVSSLACPRQPAACGSGNDCAVAERRLLRPHAPSPACTEPPYLDLHSVACPPAQAIELEADECFFTDAQGQTCVGSKCVGGCKRGGGGAAPDRPGRVWGWGCRRLRRCRKPPGAAASPQAALATTPPNLHPCPLPPSFCPSRRRILQYVRQHHGDAWLAWAHEPEYEEGEWDGPPAPLGGGFTMRRK